MPDAAAPPLPPEAPTPAPAPEPAPATGPDPSRRTRDAILYVPGIGDVWDQKALGGLASQVAAAMGRQLDGGRQFRCEASKDGRCCSILVRDSDGDAGVTDRPLIDLYALDYRRTIIDDFEARTPFKKCLLLFAATFGSSPRFTRMLFRRGISPIPPRERFQIWYAMLLISLTWVYLLLLVAALVPAIQAAWSPAIDATFNAVPRSQDWWAHAWAFARNAWNAFASRAPALIALGTFLWALVTPSVKAKIEAMMTNTYCLYQYLNFGDMDRLAVMLHDRVAEVKDLGYRNVHVVSYSFGTVVAFNAFFPTARKPLHRLEDVGALISIGFPFDMVRTYWPRYFLNRQAAPDMPRLWLNVYSPLDILSSNIRNDGKIAGPDPEILKDCFRPNPEQDPVQARSAAVTAAPVAADDGAGPSGPIVPSPVNVAMHNAPDTTDFTFWESLTLMGLRMHTGYWNPADPRAMNCFDEVLAILYRAHGGEPADPDRPRVFPDSLPGAE